MPDLPTMTVTGPQATRILAAFGSVAAYRKWLRDSVIAYTLQSEMLARLANDRAALEAEIAPADPPAV